MLLSTARCKMRCKFRDFFRPAWPKLTDAMRENILAMILSVE